VRDVLTTALISGTREGHSAENAAKFMELGPERALLTYTRSGHPQNIKTSSNIGPLSSCNAWVWNVVGVNFKMFKPTGGKPNQYFIMFSRGGFGGWFFGGF
jgi:hypothetical protein